MEIDKIYKLSLSPLELRVVELMDFQDMPILNLEVDVIGNKYLTYLIGINNKIEQRAAIQISRERLNEVRVGNMKIKYAFDNPENKSVYILEYESQKGVFLNAYLLPIADFITINPIESDYSVYLETDLITPELNELELIDYSIRKNKVIFDIYLQSPNLVNNVKLYAINKVLNPMVEILKEFFHVDQRGAEKYFALSNFREKSLGVSIEINASQDLFLDSELRVLNNVMALFNAKTKEDLISLLNSTPKESYIKEYSTIIKAIINNDASLSSAYTNPINKEVKTSLIDKTRAIEINKIINEAFPIIEDIEVIRGVFLEIDISILEPSFKILSEEYGVTFRGKIDSSLLDRLKMDNINFGTNTYDFTIKTLYTQETPFRKEDFKRFLIEYVKA